MKRLCAAARNALIALFLIAFAVFLGLLSGAGQGNSATTKYWFQGTGPTVPAPPDARHNADRLVNMSGDRGWKAEIAPVQGTSTMDQSIGNAKNLAKPSIKNELASGNRVAVEGFSLGAVSAGDLADEMAREGVNLSNVDVTLISDGRMPNSGALVVLEPIAPLLKLAGMTAGPRTSTAGRRTYACIEGDAICDLPDPTKDPVGAVDATIGYFMKHGGGDPTYNYGNRDKLAKTVVYKGDDRYITYHAPRAMTLVAQKVFGNEAAGGLDKVLDALILSEGNPGEKKTYESLPESVVKALGIPVPKATPAPAIVPVNGGNGGSNAPMSTGGMDQWIEQGIGMLENFANQPVATPTPAIAEAPAPASIPAPVQQFAPQIKQVIPQAQQMAKQIAPQLAPQIDQAAKQIGDVFGIPVP